MKYPYSLTELPNKLRVLHVPSDSSESVSVVLSGKVGRRAELESEIGSAHFLEHLFFDGTAKRPTAPALNKFIEDQGGKRGGMTGSEIVSYSAKVISSKAETAFEFISDILLNSLLNESDIEKEKNVIAQEASMKHDDPRELIVRIIRPVLYPGHSLSRTIFDEEKTLKDMTREKLLSYMERNYVANNLLLVVSGNISQEKAFEYADKYFKDLKPGKEVVFDPPQIKETQEVDILHKDFSQSCLSVAFRGVSIVDPKFWQLSLLSTILGRSASSRLYEKLRHEHHLIYTAHSMMVSFSDSGFLTITAYIKEENIQKTLDLIFIELKSLVEKGVTAEELERAKIICLSDLLFRIEDVHKRADFISERIIFGDQDLDIEKEIDKIKQITREQIQEMAQYVFSDKPKISIITKSLDNIEVNF